MKARRGQVSMTSITPLQTIDGPFALPASLTEISSWGPLIMVLLSSTTNAVVRQTLRHLGAEVVEMRPSPSLVQLADRKPVALTIITPEVVVDPQGINVLQALRRRNPEARILLLSPGTPDISAFRAGVQEVVDPDNQVQLIATLRAELQEVYGRRKRVLAIGAHPDDIEIGCGGTLLHHRDAGDQISLLTLSRGEAGGSAIDRTEEARTNAAVLGAQLLIGDLPDTRISDGIGTIGPIEEVVAALVPTTVYVHSESDGHQDHRAVHLAALSATRGAPTVLAYQSPSSRTGFRPTAFVPIDATLTGKLALLAGYRTQAQRPYLDPDAVTATSRYWARHISASTRYVEPFEVIRTVSHMGFPG